MSRLPWAGSLFWKGVVAFFVVIVVAVGTVALLSGWITEVELRRYVLAQSGRWDRQVAELAAYYELHRSWDGVQAALANTEQGGAGQQGRGRGGAGRTLGPPEIQFWLVDGEGNVVGSTVGDLGVAPPQVEMESGTALPIEVAGRIVGYVVPAQPIESASSVTLDVDQAEFLSRVRSTLAIAGLAAAAVALVVGGLLFWSIVSPLRRLTVATQAIANGDLSARAPVKGRDEVSQLANAFNRMADSLSRAEEARQNQVADVAHELRTPLTILQGLLEAMLDGVYRTDRTNLEAGLAQVRTLGRLVEDLRVLALSDAGQLRLHRERTDLAQFLPKLTEASRAQAQDRNVALALDLASDLPPIAVDRDRLSQVVGNLLSNALRYARPRGQVTVRAESRVHEVQVSVQDDGPGIPAEDLPHLFERFWRGDRARRRETGGSGLGLAIARSLVEAHGGRIWANSVQGEGSTFAFVLPVSDDGPPPP